MNELICICCPIGCRVAYELSGTDVTSVSGNKCKKGEDYAVTEITAPARVLTCLARNSNGNLFSVKSVAPIPKAKLLDCSARLKELRPNAPVRCGDIIADSVCGVSCGFVATSDAD